MLTPSLSVRIEFLCSVHDLCKVDPKLTAPFEHLLTSTKLQQYASVTARVGGRIFSKGTRVSLDIDILALTQDHSGTFYSGILLSQLGPCT